jgi:hemolysin III
MIKFITKLREPMNGFTHFIGFILAALASVLLLLQAVHPLRIYHFIAFTVFCTGMLLLYAMSTIYHWARLSPSGVKKLRTIDHIMIFIMIAGTYTPICLIPLRNSFGYPLLIGIWATALAGVIFKLFWLTAPRWLSTVIYISMGWMAILVIAPLLHLLETGALLWLFAGGVFYTTGAVIYGMKKPNLFSIFGFHELFHVFVMLGSFSHFWLMYKYITLLG